MSADWSAVRNAYRDGEYSKCLELLEGAAEPQASIWRARVDLRQVRYAQVISGLHALTCPDEESSAERDVWLGVAYASSGDFSMARTLLERAVATLKPPHEAYYRGMYSLGLTAHLAGDSDAALASTDVLLTSPDPCDRGQAHAMRSWVAVKRGDVETQLRGMQDALTEYLGAERTDQYGLAHTVQALAIFCRERPIDDAVVECVRAAAERVRLSDATAFPYFQTIRILGWVDALHGDEVSAMRRWRDAQSFAPSQFWHVFCIVDRAYLSHVMGRRERAAELLQEADRLAQELPWAQTQEEERLILMTLAQLFSRNDPARAERYLAMYRSLNTSMDLRLNWQGDRRLRALQRYPHAVALLHLGEPETAIAMLEEAWSIFTELDYRWRAALAALDLYNATGGTHWLERAREQAAPWPKSWVAREVRELG